MKKHLFLIMVATAVIAVSCSKSEDNGDGYTFSNNDPISMDLSVTKNDVYGVKTFELDKAKLTSAFGGSIPAGLQFYAINSDGKRIVGTDNYTSEYGFYFTNKGDVCMPSDDSCAYFIEYYTSAEGYANPTIGIGQFPGACVVGDTITLRVGLTDGTLIGQPYKLIITITKASDWAVYFENSDKLTYTVYQTRNTEYKALEVVVDQAALCSALGVSTAADIVTGVVTNKDITFVGVNADNSLYTTGYTANNYGHWFNTSGNVCAWASTGCAMYSEWYGTAPVSFNIGQYPSGLSVGDKYTIRQSFVKGTTTVILTFKIRIVDSITDDLGPDETK
jgi:hypothetical protein